MKNNITFNRLLFFSLLLTFSFFSYAQNTYRYESVSGDAMKTRIYTLNNGLKVYLSAYPDQPRIQTFVAVNTGSKNDPSTATGLAHYLEHIMFKGSTKYGTMNWDQEKNYLTEIESLFELHRNTKDSVMRKKIYHQIDSVSLIAATYAIANEYSKMLNQIGASGTNAYTWIDQTVYVNDIPSNQIERWAKIEAERFSVVVPRLFHTELEAVYEEKNKGLDNDSRKIWEKMYEGLFPNHPYGTQTTIGTIEHLKNPSITEIKKYFNTYYKANNMAICMSGDLDYDKTIQTIAQYFESLPQGPIPTFNMPAKQALQGPVIKNVYGPTAESVSIGYRIEESLQSDPRLISKLKILSAMLYNGQAGLIDLNINQAQLALNAYASPIYMHDYQVMLLGASPVHGTSLQETTQRLTQQIELLQKGNFDAALLKGVVTDFKKSASMELESNKQRADKMVDAFILNIPWKYMVDEIEFMQKVTVQDIQAWAIQFLKKENSVLVYKNKGIDSSIIKVKKPSISAVTLNRDTASAFYNEVFQLQTKAIEPVFLDFHKDLTFIDTNTTLPIIYKQNKENNLFSLNYVWDISKEHDLKFSLMSTYVAYCGAGKFSNAELQNEFYKIGCSYEMSSNTENITFSITGLHENLKAALQLAEQILQKPIEDTFALANIKANILKTRQDQKASKDAILRQAMNSYAKYGSDNPFKNILTEKQLQSITSNELLALLKQLTLIKHKVLYYGPESASALKKIVKSNHQTGHQLLPTKQKVFTQQAFSKNKVYFVNYDMVQAEIVILQQSNKFSEQSMIDCAVFNEYFGGSMNSLVFQELRESKALAYAVKSNYALANKRNDYNFQYSYIGTQADKMKEAMSTLLNLTQQFNQSEALYNNSVSSIQESIRTERIDKMDVIMTYEQYKRLGIHQDVRASIYKQLENYSYEKMLAFHEQYIKGRTQTILVIGSKDKINMNDLASFGEVQELSLEEVFGY